MTETAFSPDIFRAYDIRGIVGEGFNPAVVHLIGKAIASEALTLGEHTLIVGRDARLSSPAFAEAMISGILDTGCNVINIGTVPTPVLYFATHTLGARSGVMITGSHNPGNYNGIKIVINNHCLADSKIQDLKTRIEKKRFLEGEGRLENTDISQAYIERITSDIAYQRPLKLVIDAGNGVTGLVAPALFSALDCEVIPLYCEPDGHFPNHHPDPTVATNLEDLIAAVSRHRADLGIALDGDGDRVGLVTATGQIIDADKMMMCFISDILPENPGATVVFDVKSSFHLFPLIQANGGKALMCKSGHSFVKQKMLETAAIFGGEYSAHIFFLHRWYGFDDGIYTAARFLELMDRYDSSADQLLDRMPASISTPELGIDVSEAEKFSLMDKLASNIRLPGASINHLDGIRADYDLGWGLLRASNTTPKLICRFEARHADALAQIQNDFRRELTRLTPQLVLPF